MSNTELQKLIETNIEYYRKIKKCDPKYIMMSQERFEEVKKLKGYNAKTKCYKGIKVQIGG